jgi:hypothetical protein
VLVVDAGGLNADPGLSPGGGGTTAEQRNDKKIIIEIKTSSKV